jgi:hypothetical protein
MHRIDGRYACSRSMQAVHEIIPPGSQVKQNPDSYSVWGFFIAEPLEDDFECI